MPPIHSNRNPNHDANRRARQPRPVHVLWILGLAWMTACGGSPPADPPSGGGDGGYDTTQTTCDVSATLEAEISGGVYTWPTEVGGTMVCDFDNFAWQEFLYLVAGGDNAMTFESWPSRDAIFGQPLPGPGVPATSTQLAKSHVPVVDRNGNPAHFSIYANGIEQQRIADEGCGLTNRSCFDSQITVTSDNPYVGTSTTQLADRSAELKLSWMISPCASLDDTSAACVDTKARFLVAQGSVAEGETAILQLVGFHVVQKMADTSKDWVWATFEHIDNAPDCDAPSPTAPDGDPWNFYSECSGGNECLDNYYCGLCEYDAAITCGGNDPNALSTPVEDGFQICSPDPRNCSGLSVCQSVYKSQVCRSQPIATAAPEASVLNQEIHALLGDSVLTNYQLVGTQWTDPTAGTLQGDQKLSNTTMETYLQSFGCLVCHSANDLRSPTDPEYPNVDGPKLDHSFIFYAMQGQPASRGCGEGVPAAICQTL